VKHERISSRGGVIFVRQNAPCAANCTSGGLRHFLIVFTRTMPLTHSTSSCQPSVEARLELSGLPVIDSIPVEGK